MHWNHRLAVAGAVAGVCCALSPRSDAELLSPGDLRARHEIQLLADAGLLAAPTTSWPISTRDLALIGDADPSAGLTQLREHAGGLAGLAQSGADRNAYWALAAGGVDRPFTLRGFEQLPRGKAQVGATAGWRGSRVAARLSLGYLDEPADSQALRLDGSFLGISLGNWFVAASAMDRWWGPGWDGSLILSNNARPVPALIVQRRESRRPALRGFRWIGPWTMQALIGQLESDRDHANARLFGWRFAFRPLPRLEIGLARGAQWCGAGRPCDFDTFLDMLSGVKDNRGDNVTVEEEPGNQLAGLDLRYAFSVLGRPWAAYGQRIGEDEQDGRPSAWLRLYGLETWNRLGAAGVSYRLHVEYADTACGRTNFGCAYNHSIYTDGYRYRARPIGHTLDGDGRMLSAGAFIVTDAGHTWHMLVRRAELNRGDSTRNTVSAEAAELGSLELSHTRHFDWGALSLGVSRESGELIDDDEAFGTTRVFASWRWSLPQR